MHREPVTLIWVTLLLINKLLKKKSAINQGSSNVSSLIDRFIQVKSMYV